jgi:hypothetical protein
MNNIKVTMKIYPVEERKEGQHWSESQKKRFVSLRIMDGKEKPSEEMANTYHRELLKLGYAATDYNTHTKIVNIEDLLEEQVRLHKLFDITLTN